MKGIKGIVKNLFITENTEENLRQNLFFAADNI